MVDVTKLIERLETLDREATKGPWTPTVFRPNGKDIPTVEEMKAEMVKAIDATAEFSPGHDFTMIFAPNVSDDKDKFPNIATSYTANGPHSYVNAEVAAETRNALPLLIAALKGMQKAVEQEKVPSGFRHTDEHYAACNATEQAARDFAALCKQESQP